MSKYTHLTQLERDRISTILTANHTYSTIAEVLGRYISTISLEVYRNHVDGSYLPSSAQKMSVPPLAGEVHGLVWKKFSR